jgi:hypothetical protein
MILIQLLLPLTSVGSADIAGMLAETRRELVEEFGGVTAYFQTPAHGVWTSPEGFREDDRVVMIEVVTREFDRSWWSDYIERLRNRFVQDAIHVRASTIELLDGDSA